MENRVYCTCFDHNYLSRGLALYHSLQRHAPGSRLWVLCLSNTCYQVLVKLDLPDLIAVPMADFEAADLQAAATRSSRSTIEYYFTCTPAWLLYVLERETTAEWVTYLDGDLYFFESPETIFAELNDAAVAIIPHRYTDKLQRLRKFGIYNVGWVGARNDPDGIAVVKWWREQCIDWCYDYVDGGRFADQGYLDSFSRLFARVKVIENVGANLAPWNIGNHRIDIRDNKVLIDGKDSLIFFHFQGLKKSLGWFIFNSHRRYRAPFSQTASDHIYQPYVDELLAIEKNIDPIFDASDAKPLQRSGAVDGRRYLRSKIQTTRDRVFQLLDIVSGRAFLVVDGMRKSLRFWSGNGLFGIPVGAPERRKDIDLNKPLRVGVILEQPLEVGGGFQQPLNDLLWFRDWAKSAGTEIVVFTPHARSIELLQEFGVRARFLKANFLDGLALFMKYLGPFDLFQRFLRVRVPLEKQLMRNGIDVVYFTTTSIWHLLLYKLPFIITIFDGCHRDAPEFDEVREFGEFERREILFRSASTKAVLVVANSAGLIADLGRRYALEPNRAICIPFSPSTYVTRSLTNDSTADAAVLEKYGLQPGYLFYPAQFWSHKNHSTLLAAVALLRDEGSTHKLVLCGSDRGAGRRIDSLVAHYNLADQVSIIGFVDSTELGALYRAASALVMPSYFGPANLPPLEAWTVGTPVIYPEEFESFVGDAAVLFDYDNTRSLADAILRTGSPEVRASLRKAGDIRLQHFSEQIKLGRQQFADNMERLKFRRLAI